LQIREFARIAQIYAVPVSAIVRKTICRFYGSWVDESSLSVRGRQNRLIRLGEHPVSRNVLAIKIRVSDALPFGRLRYGEPNAISNAVDYAKFRSRSHDAVIHVYDEAGNVIENARVRGRVQRVVSGVCHRSGRFCFLNAK
jgi:hypothetical protein